VYKLLLLSVLIATVAIPLICARDVNPYRGIKRALFAMVIFAFSWLLAIKYIYPKLFYPNI
jgi:hypothetical protein